MTSLRINGARLNDTLQSTSSQWGAIPDSPGMCRLSLSQADKLARDWLIGECEALGCATKVDQMGNIFAVRPGKAPDRKPIGMGSHMDTQPAGGRYDGILGVQAALEALRTLHERGAETHCPVALIDWTNEEGARFPGAMMASGVWSGRGAAPLAACHATRDSDGVAMRDALARAGYLGETACDWRENGLQAHFELHIEQGPVLEEKGLAVGVVTGVQGMKWFEVRVTGEEGHSGTTPMTKRSDALATASRLITAVNDAARSSPEMPLGGVATVGVIKCDTSSQATIPAGVTFIIDVRARNDDAVSSLSTDIFTRFDSVMRAERDAGSKTAYAVARTWGLPESKFHPDCIAAVRGAAVDEVGAEQVDEMMSRAGHDSAWTSRVVPTGMIFVPSKGGISHNPHEYTSPEHCALGGQVLLQAVLKYDELCSKGTIPAS
ncbi:hypothetical protein BDY21DRAFT_390218 [Lineolata rhizophorae]|uniref:Peptidase M20 dimerisation domain-containing protein n=1 Tax=Lineolata rhizophorae TaxID=578093 RepID=A0A6A6PEL6_9PEZI|nr:hypothetical protein BDY21DRAFT_390218 [Lineolata rhizophorae]